MGFPSFAFPYLKNLEGCVRVVFHTACRNNLTRSIPTPSAQLFVVPHFLHIVPDSSFGSCHTALEALRGCHLLTACAMKA